jgi:ribosomal protein L40E
MPKKMTPQRVERYRDQGAIYEKFNPEGRLHVVCPQCSALVLLCDSLSRLERRELAQQAAGEPVAALERLRTMLPCGDREAKAIVAHLRCEGEGCRHCGATMPRGALLCARCMSVNLDWA